MRTKIPNYGDFYKTQFKNQIGAGSKTAYFDGMLRQGGYGLGSFLGNLVRDALPVIAGAVIQHKTPNRIITRANNRDKKNEKKTNVKDKINNLKKAGNIKRGSNKLGRGTVAVPVKRKKYRRAADIF